MILTKYKPADSNATHESGEDINSSGSHDASAQDIITIDGPPVQISHKRKEEEDAEDVNADATPAKKQKAEDSLPEKDKEEEEEENDDVIALD